MDAIFEVPRLVAIYDALDADRNDLDAYLAITDELGAHHVLDLGCGTGTFALLLADRGITVTAIDPARGSLDFARARPGAAGVEWVLGDARGIDQSGVDLTTMTGNVAQAIIEDADWEATLVGVGRALRPGGHLVFETRDPARRPWQEWTRAATRRIADVDGVGRVETWIELTEVRLPLVSFRQSWAFASDGAVLNSDSTVRFRGRDELAAALHAQDYHVDDIRDAPDRPGRELVFLAHRTP